MSTAAEFPWVQPDSETELRAAFDRAPVGLAKCRAHGEITALNPALEQLLARRSRLGRGLFFSDLIHTEDKARGERLLRELSEGRRQSFQLDSRSPAGNETVVRWSGWHVPGTKNTSDYILLLAQETGPSGTDSIGPPEKEHESQQRTGQAQRLEAVGRLAGGVAHDFNNLLTGVLLYSDLLMAGLDAGHPARKYAEEIRSAGVQASGLVRQLLAVAKPSRLGPRPILLNEIIDSVRGMLLRLIGENIHLEFRLDPSLGLIKIDPTQAQQILLNLVLNARDAMPGGGEIRVETSNCRVQALNEHSAARGPATSIPCALFAVEDNGSGMDEVTRARMFEPFFTTKGGSGTGLGLATVYEIVTSNGGLIHVDSLPGRGTRVTALLPLAPAEVNSQKDRNLPERQEGAHPIIEKESTL